MTETIKQVEQAAAALDDALELLSKDIARLRTELAEAFDLIPAGERLGSPSSSALETLKSLIGIGNGE